MAAADVALPSEPTVPKDGGIIQTYPGTAFEKRRKHVPHGVNVEDLRPISKDFNLDNAGFELVTHATKVKDFKNEEEIKRVYYKEASNLIKKHSGASEVLVISHMVRNATHAASLDAANGKDDLEFVTTMNPARFVHVDQSFRGAEQILFLNLPEEEAERRLKKRWGILNVWQPIEKPVARDPLGFCDYRSLDHDDFRVVVANLPPPHEHAGEYGKVSKNMTHNPRADYSSNGEIAPRYEVTNLAYNPNQRWYYASEQKPEEAWVFKIFDSKNDGRAKCAAHSSFPLKGQGDYGEPRTSIEVRCLVFWDDENPE